MNSEDTVYRNLQQHLDKQAIGFPSTGSGADIRFLKRLFTPDEARLALFLSYQPLSTARITEQAAPEFEPERIRPLLEGMFAKGAIGWKERQGQDHWFVMPVVVGMYEAQDGSPTPDFLADADTYMKTVDFGKSFLAVSPSQMRTIPIRQSIPVEHHVATYDHIRSIIESARGPFVVLKCICRERMAMKGEPCARTARSETCLAMNDTASMVLRRGHGREITRQEALDLLQQSEDDGLVLQPANSRSPEFVCSCCGCCCGMLSFQKFLPHPVDFWTSNFYAEASADLCSRCGTCVSRCQVGAAAMDGPGDAARISMSRCIGCGLCVPTCPSNALSLKPKTTAVIPPADEEALLDEIMANKKGSLRRLRMLMKVALRMRQ